MKSDTALLHTGFTTMADSYETAMFELLQGQFNQRFKHLLDPHFLPCLHIGNHDRCCNLQLSHLPHMQATDLLESNVAEAILNT